MNRINSKRWVIIFVGVVIVALFSIAIEVIRIDPFFHYHKPLVDKYFYTLDNQRSQNDGILKHFDYDAIITGTSMTENFKTSEMDKLFGTNAIKTSFSGGSYKEINDNIAVALKKNRKIKIVVRSLDYVSFFANKDAMRKDLGKYPIYLYDDNIFNDVKYIFNRDIVMHRLCKILSDKYFVSIDGGITSFDDYSNWMKHVTFGIKTVCPDGVKFAKSNKLNHLTEKEKETILGTVEQNVTSLADKYLDVDFYYFFTPYSAIYWMQKLESGNINKQIEGERIVIEQILPHKNIKLFSFNNLFDITTDLNNYKDTIHYGEWINSLMLRYMKEDKYRLTYDNYKEYLDKELDFYTKFDYESLNNQEDYEDDYYMAILVKGW